MSFLGWLVFIALSCGFLIFVAYLIASEPTAGDWDKWIEENGAVGPFDAVARNQRKLPWWMRGGGPQ